MQQRKTSWLGGLFRAQQAQLPLLRPEEGRNSVGGGQPTLHSTRHPTPSHVVTTASKARVCMQDAWLPQPTPWWVGEGSAAPAVGDHDQGLRQLPTCAASTCHIMSRGAQQHERACTSATRAK